MRFLELEKFPSDYGVTFAELGAIGLPCLYRRDIFSGDFAKINMDDVDLHDHLFLHDYHVDIYDFIQTAEKVDNENIQRARKKIMKNYAIETRRNSADKDIPTKERDSYLTVIVALYAHIKKKPSASPCANVIASRGAADDIAAKVGEVSVEKQDAPLSISRNTVGKIIKEIQERILK